MSVALWPTGATSPAARRRPHRTRRVVAIVLLLVLPLLAAARLVVLRIAAASATGIIRFSETNRAAVPLAGISTWLPQAVVSIEDERFYQHGAADPRGLARALVSDVTGGPVEGGSTFTQQFAKNVLVQLAVRSHDVAAQRAATARTPARKLRELELAIGVEQRMSKDQILTGYLNVVCFGEGGYGVDAAARDYFGVAPADLSLAQAALLAGLVQAPTAYDPLLHPALAKTRRNVVLRAMYGQGRINRAQLGAALATPLPR